MPLSVCREGIPGTRYTFAQCSSDVTRIILILIAATKPTYYIASYIISAVDYILLHQHPYVPNVSMTSDISNRSSSAK